MNKQIITVDIDPETGEEWETVTELDEQGRFVSVTIS